MEQKSSNFFGNTIKEFRKLKGFTETEMAEHIQVSIAKWVEYEEGKDRPESLETIILIAEKFGVDPVTFNDILFGRLQGYFELKIFLRGKDGKN